MSEYETGKRHRREYRLLQLVRGLACMLPPWLVPAQRGFFRFLLSLSRTHNRRALFNLERAFPSWEPALRKAVLRRMRNHFACLLQEVLLLSHPGSEPPKVDVLGLKNLEAALQKGRGALLFSAHLGNWELIPLALSQSLGQPLAALARRMDNPLVEQEVARFRQRMGGRIIPNKQSMRQTLETLRRGEPVFLLMDQNTISREGLFVPFFGEPACTVTSPAQLHHRHGVPLVPLLIHRTRTGGHQLIIYPPLLPEEKTRGDQSVLTSTTAWCNRHIEKAIRRHPEQWLWFHDRWRTRPAPEEKTP